MNDHGHLEKLLQRYPGLSNHLDANCRNLLLKARPVSFASGSILFREADPCLDFMWLIDGSVRLYKHSEDGREVTLYRVCAGELCILSLNNLLHGRPYAAEARSEEPVTGLLFSGTDFQTAIDTSSGFRQYVLGMLTNRLDEVMQLVADVVFRRLDLRLACLRVRCSNALTGSRLRLHMTRSRAKSVPAARSSVASLRNSSISNASGCCGDASNWSPHRA